MRNVKEAAGAGKKALAKGGGKRPIRSAVPRTTRSATGARTARPSKPAAERRPSISEAQSKVVASKFHTEVEAPAKNRARPTLPSSYGESHLLLLVRDPQTLFAAWDMSPSAVESLKAGIGSRAFAVSTLTLRLTRAGGGTSIVHVGKKARSRYLKIDGGPSFLAEIGFTTPTGRFELVARSSPCFVPTGPSGQESVEAVGRAVLGYREARALSRRGMLNAPQAVATGRSRAAATPKGGLSSPMSSATPRVLGGASDLYRR